MDEMTITMGGTLQSEPETAQRKWLMAQNMGQRVAAIISMEMGRVQAEVVDKVASSLRLMVSKMEKGLRSINQFQLHRSVWPVDNVAVWAPDAGAWPQLEFQEATMSPDTQQMVTV